jgi:hypothetical protein
MERERERWVYLFFDTAEVNSYTESIVLNSSSSDAFWTFTQNFAHLWSRGVESPTTCKNSINHIFHHNLQYHNFFLVSHWTPKPVLGYKLNCALRHDCFLNEKCQKIFSLNWLMQKLCRQQDDLNLLNFSFCFSFFGLPFRRATWTVWQASNILWYSSTMLSLIQIRCNL